MLYLFKRIIQVQGLKNSKAVKKENFSFKLCSFAETVRKYSELYDPKLQIALSAVPVLETGQRQDTRVDFSCVTDAMSTKSSRLF